MKRLICALAVLTACSDVHFSLKPDSSLDHMRKLTLETPECVALDNKNLGWMATSVVAGVLGGGSGVTSLLTDNTPRYVVSSVGIGLSALAALSSFLSTQYAARYTRQCLTAK